MAAHHGAWVFYAHVQYNFDLYHEVHTLFSSIWDFIFLYVCCANCINVFTQLEITSLPQEATICGYCGISYLIHPEIKRLEQESNKRLAIILLHVLYMYIIHVQCKLSL